MPERNRLAGIWIAIGLSVSGCGVGDGAETDPVGHYHRAQRYEARAFAVASDAENGAALRVLASPREGWKFSLEFPVSVRVRFGGDDATVARAAGDARRFDADGLEFDLLPPAASTAIVPVTGSVSFAVCRGEVCDRIDHDFRLPASP